MRGRDRLELVNKPAAKVEGFFTGHLRPKKMLSGLQPKQELAAP
jgi:hypothetical protein